MISLAQDKNYYHAVIFNEFTLQDFREFEQHVLYASRFEGPISILLDLREMSGYTIDMALEEVKFSKEHRQDIEKIAIVTTDQWVTWSAWLTRMITDAEILVFEDIDEAQSWIMPKETAGTR